MAAPVACTIVSNNYLAYARVLARSFLGFHPEGRFFVLIVDRAHPDIDYAGEPFTTVFAHELAIPGFENFAFRYSILELNTAVKPYFLEHLHREHGVEALCFLDPDIQVTGDLGPLFERVEASDAALVPHVLQPIEDDGIPSERDFLLSGIYNLGFLGLSFNEHTLPFLRWWQDRLHRHCRHSVEEGLFVDQKWMDFAPSFLPRVDVIRDPGYNVAYWNAMHRTVEHRDDGPWVGEHRLRFFHFSGVDPARPEVLSKYQNRLGLADRPDLQPLFREYHRRLQAEGWQRLRTLPYAYGVFDNGVPVPGAARAALQRLDPRGERWPRPFDAGGTFYAWLREPVGPDPVDGDPAIPLPRIAICLWEQRADLEQAFPDPALQDREVYARWFATEGAADAGIPPAFVQPLAAALGRLGDRAPADTGAGEGSAADRSRERMQAMLAPSSRGAPCPAAFAELSADEVGWLTADGGDEPRRRPLVPRLALMIHRRRADLRQWFPEPLGGSRIVFAYWFATYGRLEYGLPAALVRPLLRSFTARHRLSATLWWWWHGVVRPRVR